MERFKMIASSYLILVADGKIFLSRRFNTGYEDGKYSLPAGHVENGESLTQCAAREVFDEIGVRIKLENLQLVHVMHRKEEDIRMDFFFTQHHLFRKSGAGFTADIGDQQPTNKEPEKCDDLGWFPLNKLPVNTIPYIRHAIECYQKKIFYSEFGWTRKPL